ncbi:MAG: hypothetical protein M1821_009450 [Bathelium mastoideum]|nr:MAG: hypothetical protein M1821_009450 [Bathelium mastoideum]KAI9688668.1 MAG: hypothetical protein M1822_001025 [Bathelium mastoideum]
MADKDIKEGDEVSWQWSGGRPGGTAAEVAKEGQVAIESHRGNTIAKNAEPDNPAVHVERPGNDVVKKASELDVEEEGPKHNGGEEKNEEEGDEEKEEKKDNGAKPGKKRAAKGKPEGEENAKKQKKEDVNGEGDSKEKKGKGAGRGRPKKGSVESNGASKPKAEKKEKPKKEPKKAATADGQPRRSARNKSS